MFGFGVDDQLQKKILSEAEKLKAILKRLLDVTLFLASRGLPFQGSSTKIGEVNNGNFLGILELLGRYDEVTRDHLAIVEKYQNKGESMIGKTHYLSWMSQNEFVTLCGEKVINYILNERTKSIYYGVIFDATPALYSQRSAHSLILVGVNAVKINSRVKTFFGCVQTL